MSELATLARPYAIAAYKRAKETGAVPKWSETLAFLAQIMGDARLARAEANPKGSRERFIRALLDLCEDRLDRESENFVRILAENRRLGLIDLIRERFEQYRADEEGYIEVAVSSAYPLEDWERERIASVLRKALDKEPRLTVGIDESLIGGILVKAGDRVIDASVRGQIQRLAQSLYH
jgi:F-type H+-transporting ATPase subunit delta